MSEYLLEIKGLKTHFFTDIGVARAVDGVSYGIPRGKTLGIVGESGCGKSVTAMSILGLIPQPPGKIVAGEILYNGVDLTKLNAKDLRAIRGNDIAMIFQEPMTALNPVYTVGNQIMEVLFVHEEIEPQEARKRAIAMLAKVGIPSPETRIDEYPHQLSGGMRQRVMIAMALICNPEVLIADEPTTALDVTIQAQILELMNELQETMGTSILMITHDLGVVAEVCDAVVVMYAGKVAEKAEIHALFESPRHPYTIALLKSLPSVEGRATDKLHTIRGMVPSAVDFSDGCRFADRCDFATEACEVQPELEQVGEEHWVACHHLDVVQSTYGENK